MKNPYAILCMALLMLLSAGASAQQYDDSFQPGLMGNGVVLDAKKQADGKFVVAGEFNFTSGYQTSRIVRLHANGEVDDSFDMWQGPNAQVAALAIQADGKILAAGQFTLVKGQPKKSLVRFNTNGSIDPTFTLDSYISTATIREIAVLTDQSILVGGFMTGTDSKQIFLLKLNADGTIASTFNAGGTGPNGQVNEIKVGADNKIYIGGSFTTYNGVSANRIARLNSDGTADVSFAVGSGANNIVNSIVFDNLQRIVIAGSFTTFNGTTMRNVARLESNGALDISFNPGLGAGAGSSVLGLLVQADGKIIVAGSFLSFNSHSTYRIARLNETGSADVTFNSNDQNLGVVNCLIDDGNKFYAGYSPVEDPVLFSRINTDGSKDYSFIMPYIQSKADVRKMAFIDDKILVTGNMDAGIDNNISRPLALLKPDGDYVLDNTGPFNNFHWNTYSSVGGSIQAMAIQADKKIVMGGTVASFFKPIITSGQRSLTRLNTDGTIDETFNVGTATDQTIYSIAIFPDNKILVAGQFTMYNGVASGRVVKLNTDGSADGSFTTGTGFNNTVYALKVLADGKVLAGGQFTQYNGTPVGRIVRLNINGTLDNTFNANISAPTGVPRIVDIEVQADGKILIGGTFRTADGQPSNYIARLNTDGSRDATFVTGEGFNSAVNDLAIDVNGKIIAGGFFTAYNSTPCSELIRLNTDGSRDAAFNMGIFKEGTNVMAVLIQADQKILVGSNFADIDTDDWRGHGIMRIDPTPVAPPSDLQVTSASWEAIALSWAYPTATDNIEFFIERSVGDNTHYVQIGSKFNDTEYVDDNDLEAGNQYFYRVRAMVIGGRSVYSNEVNHLIDVVMDLERPAADAYEVFPNPASSVLHVKLAKGIYECSLVNVSGFSILKKQIISFGESQPVDIGNVPEGLYILKFSDKTLRPRKVAVRR